jgi:phage terminase large subunit
MDEVQHNAIYDIIRWRREPWSYVREVLHAEPDAWQDEILHALPANFMLALKACKGPGKTCVLAWIVLWFLTCFDDPKVLCTSITQENLRDGLWAEISFWQQKSELCSAALVWQSERIFLKERPETWFASARAWPKDADRTKQANTLAGLHARHTMIVLDEAGDIPEGVLAAGLAHHSTQDPNHASREVHYTILAGNPTRTDGSLGTACIKMRDKFWVKEITGDPDAKNRAPRIDIVWAREQIQHWGRDNPWVLVNVFGQFPPVQGNKLFGEPLVRACMAAVFPEQAWRRMPKLMGVDVARSLGLDRSVMAKRQGPVVFPLRVWRIDDLMTLASQIAFEWSQWRADAIFVDMTGLGAGVYDRLIQLGLPAIGINFGQSPNDKTHYADKRSEMWWKLHLAAKGVGGQPGIALPVDDELVAELCAPEAQFDRKGRLRIQSKDDLKKLGFKSPDKADALSLTYGEVIGTDLASYPDDGFGAVSRGTQDYDPYERA